MSALARTTAVANPLAAERNRLLAAIEQIEALVDGGYVEQGPAQAAQRWVFTREMLLHLSHADAQLFMPLMDDERPHAAQCAAAARESAICFYDDFRAHAERWRGQPSRENWGIYRATVRAMMTRLRALLDEEERALVPFLPARRGAGRPQEEQRSRNFAAAAWEIHRILNP